MLPSFERSSERDFDQILSKKLGEEPKRVSSGFFGASNLKFCFKKHEF